MSNPSHGRSVGKGGAAARPIVMVTTGTHGDVLPFISLGEAFVGKGHTVTLVTHAPYADMVRQAGLRFEALDSQQEYQRLLEDQAELCTRHDDVFGAMDEYLERQRIFETDLRIAQQVRTLCDARTVLVSRHEDIPSLMVAERLSIPLVLVLLAPSNLATVKVRAALFGDQFQGALRQLRADFGLPPIESYERWLLRSDAQVALWPAWFGDRRADLTEVGFVLNERIETEPVEPEMATYLAEQRPVLISSGTTKIIQPAFFTASLEACARLGIPAMAVTRFRELVPATLPAGCRWYPYLPFSTVLPQARALVHHGGIGTLAHALAAGVPQLILPDALDRPDNAQRMKKHDAAGWLKPDAWTPEAVEGELERILSPAFVDRCRSLATDGSSLTAPDAICERILELVGVNGTASTHGIADASRTAVPVAGTETVSEKVASAGSVVPVATAAKAARAAVGGRLDKLSPALRAHLAMKLAKERRKARQTIPRLVRNGVEDRFPLSFAQQRFWFLDQLQAETYNVAVAPYRLRGPFDDQRFAESLGSIIDRHEILRTTFPEVDGEPVQCVRPRGTLPLQVEDLRATVGSDGLDTAVATAIDVETRTGFDLAVEMPIRARLLILGDEHRMLILAVHHIAYDGWSTQILITDLMAEYNRRTRGGSAGEPGERHAEPVLQYADFAAWQREQLAGANLDRLLGYWVDRLRDCSQGLALPTDFPRPSLQTFAGKHLPIAIAAPLAERLRSLAHEGKTSLFAVLLAAFKVLLYRYTMQADLVVGVPTAGRSRVAFENVIGPFLNMLPIRSQLDSALGFDALVEQERVAVLEGHDHQDLPFDRLIEALPIERDASRHPLFQTIFALHQRSTTKHQFDGTTIAYLEPEQTTARVDLAFELWDENDGSVTGMIEYNRDLFAAETIERMAEHYLGLIEAVVAEPARAIGELTFLTDAERARLLPETEAPVWQVPEGSAADAFRARAADLPDAVAITDDRGTMTYAALAEVSGRLASALLETGTECMRPVATLLPNGRQHVTALVASLTAGVPYVCLDPSYPDARMRQILTDADAAVLLVDGAHRARAEALVGGIDPTNRPKILLSEEVVAQAPSTSVPRPTIAASDPVYLAYTSGSTGEPKGIVQTQGGFRYLVEWFGRRFDLGPGKTVAQWISVGHDPCYVEIFGALTAGATLAIAPSDLRREPKHVIAWLADASVSLVQLVPSFCQQMLDLVRAGAGAEALPALEAVLLTGEALPVALAQRWRETFGTRAHLWNVYGPTESILVTTHRVDPEQDTRTIPVGTPVDGCRLFVVDAGGEAAPTGSSGEIYIRSPFLARGYHGRDEATRASFVQNPLHDDYPDRVYRSGDLGAWRGDGTLVFLGRADGQVKIRGLRVELSEIEEVVARHPDVAESVVLLEADDRMPEPRLVAYVAAAEAGTADGLAAWLRERLPAYMVPSTVVAVEDMPRTATGKVDRKALRALDKPDPRHSFVSPEGPLEEQVAACFADLLGTEQVGRDDDFFALGGHSLLAARLVNQLGADTGAELYVQHLFAHPTVAELAAFLASALPRDDDPTQQQVLDLFEQVQDLSDADVAGLLSDLESPQPV